MHIQHARTRSGPLVAISLALASLCSSAAGQDEASQAAVPETARSRSEAVDAGLRWLAAHQASNGSWDVDEFMHSKHDAAPACDCTGPGTASQDVGVTGLCLLAFLGQKGALEDGLYQQNITEAARWLQAQQDQGTGLIGQPKGSHFAYDHGIASLALAEYQSASGKANLLDALERSSDYILKARNAYGAWRYDIPALGENDTSVTGWMVFALKAAEHCGIEIDNDAYVGALSWLDSVTDPETARVGYDAPGSISARVKGINDHYPADSGEAMTAIGILCRFVMGQYPRKKALLERHARLLLRALPVWDPEDLGCDMYYWYFGSHAMALIGGQDWERWQAAIRPALVDAQQIEGHQAGSWDPLGPWGYSGGRAYATALMVLSLEVE